MLLMAMLQELFDLYSDYLGMNSSFSALKKEDKSACMFDIENIISTVPNISSAFPKPESYLPPVFSRVAPHRPPFLSPTARKLNHLDPYYYRKLNFSLLS